MINEKTSSRSNAIIWFGAAVSIAEIFTGTLIAPLGFQKGLLAILLGHLIGCTLLFLSGIIGAHTGMNAMETVKRCFGKKGGILFCLLNVIQLVGWTVVMIRSGADASVTILPTIAPAIFAIIIGILIVIWLLVGVSRLEKLGTIAAILLFLLCLIVSFALFSQQPKMTADQSMSFGAAVELSAIMPVSWLPLISDYTSTARKAKKATVWSVIAYFLASSWMYLIGLQAVLVTGESSIDRVMLQAGLGIFSLLVIVLSTVTTTFMDAYSAGVSFFSVFSRWNGKTYAVIICILSTILAVFFPLERYEDFLYFIGSVFAPMSAVLIMDHFLTRRERKPAKFHWKNLLIWAFGFVCYRILLSMDTPLGSTLPAMIVTAALTWILYVLEKVFHAYQERKRYQGDADVV